MRYRTLIVLTGLYAVGITHLPAAALAQDPALYTVKIRSMRCNSTLAHTAASDLQGSGVLLQIDGRAMVLTSEHVVLHSTDQACHSVRMPDGKTRPAELRQADWGYGLALLEIKGVRPSADWLTMDHFKADGLSTDQAIVASGYPFATENLLTDRAATVLLPKSQRHLFAQQSEVVEIQGAAEFGMSGGPVSLPGADQIIGLLSHQFIELRQGQPSRVGEFGPKTPPIQNRLLVIPATSIRQWLERARSPSYAPCFIRTWEDQLLNRSVVHAGGLRFELKPLEATLLESSDFALFSGGDGAGIGGGQNMKLTHLMQISRGGRVSGPLPSSLENAFARLTTALTSEPQVQIPFVVTRGQKTSFYSLSSFFYELARYQARPVIVGSKVNQSERSAQLRKNGASTLILSKNVRAVLAESESEDLADAAELLNQIDLIAELLTTSNSELIGPEQIQGALSNPAWSVLYNLEDAFFDSTEIKSLLLRAQEILKL